MCLRYCAKLSREVTPPTHFSVIKSCCRPESSSLLLPLLVRMRKDEPFFSLLPNCSHPFCYLRVRMTYCCSITLWLEDPPPLDLAEPEFAPASPTASSRGKSNLFMLSWSFLMWEVSLSAPTYRFAPAEKQLISRQGEVVGLPALDELPADLLLLQLPLNERLTFLVHN